LLHNDYADWARGFRGTESVEIVAAGVLTWPAEVAPVAFTLV
jgi:hypothetical protein